VVFYNGIDELPKQTKSEVRAMCLYDYDEEYQRKLDRRDAKNEERQDNVRSLSMFCKKEGKLTRP